MNRELIAWDALNGIAQYHEYDPETGDSHFISVGDATPVIEQNKRYANDAELKRIGMKNDFWLYASIPTIVAFKWLTEDGVDIYKKENGAWLSRKLEDPEWAYLKTTTGKHIIKS